MFKDSKTGGIQKTKLAVDYLFALLGELVSGENIQASSQHYEWLKIGLIKYMSNGDLSSLDRSLGLAVCGSRHVSTQLNLRVRNYYLSEAIRQIALNENLTHWERCKRLSPKANQLSVFWNAHPYVFSFSNWENWKINLYKAWVLGCGLPTTTRGFYSVIENNTYSLHCHEMKIHKTIIEVQSHEKLVRNKSCW